MSHRVINIGRAPDNDIVFDHPKVSRYHARVLVEGGSLTIEEIGATNGVFVNGTRVSRCALRLGDEIRFGRVPFDTHRLQPFLGHRAGSDGRIGRPEPRHKIGAAAGSQWKRGPTGQSRGMIVALITLIGVPLVALVVVLVDGGSNSEGVTTAAKGVTDDRGELEVPNIGTLVAQSEAGAPISGVDVFVYAAPDTWLSVFRDPQGRYSPALNAGRYLESLEELAESSQPGWSPFPTAHAQPTPGERRHIVTILRHTSTGLNALDLDTYSGPLDALADVIEDPPEVLLERDNYAWVCMTEDQLIDEYGLIRELVLLPFRLAGGQLIGAIDTARDRLGYFGLTDEDVLRWLIRRLYGEHDEYLIGTPTFITIFDMHTDSEDIIQYSALRYLDPIAQNELPMWAVLGTCDDQERSEIVAGLEDTDSASSDDELNRMCQSVCSDSECAEDMFDDEPNWMSRCESLCVWMLADCGSIWDDISYCRQNYPCDGSNSWTRCLEDRIPENLRSCVREPAASSSGHTQASPTQDRCDLFQTQVVEPLIELEYSSTVRQVRGSRVTLIREMLYGPLAEFGADPVRCYPRDDDVAVNGSILVDGAFVVTFVVLYEWRRGGWQFEWIASGTVEEGIWSLTESSSSQGDRERGLLIELAREIREAGLDRVP